MKFIMKKIIVILAGGMGKRMRSEKPKVIQAINEKPLLVWLLTEVFKSDPDRVLVVVGRYKDLIRDELIRYIPDLEERIEWVMQDPALGTGHAVMCCSEQLKPDTDARTVVLYGDTPYTSADTINSMFDATREVSIMVTYKDDPYGSGRIIRDDDGRFLRIVEEKDATDDERAIKTINCGLYCFDNRLLCGYINKLGNDNAQKEYYLTDVVALIKNGEGIDVGLIDVPEENQYEVTGVNTPEQLKQLEESMKNQK